MIRACHFLRLILLLLTCIPLAHAGGLLNFMQDSDGNRTDYLYDPAQGTAGAGLPTNGGAKIAGNLKVIPRAARLQAVGSL